MMLFFQEDCGFSNSHSIRAQDLFLRTTSVPAPEVGARHDNHSNGSAGLNIALSRPKSTSVNMSSQFGGLSTTGTNAGMMGDSQLSMDRASDAMILRPQGFFDEAPGVRNFN